MRAIVFEGAGDIRLQEVPDPRLEASTDALIRVTMSGISGTDLHLVRGSIPGMRPGTILGREAVGIVEEVGRQVRNLRPGDRVVVPASIACGSCAYCRAGYYSQCDTANPNGHLAGTTTFGGPEITGSIPGLQAERARIPFANIGPVCLPDNVTDAEALLLADVFPTGAFGAELAEIVIGDTVAVFGCGPVGLFSIRSALRRGAARVLAVDRSRERLERARRLGAEVIDFAQEDPVRAIRNLTGGIGADRAIDAVGIDAGAPADGSMAAMRKTFREERQEIADQQAGCAEAEGWRAGDAPSLAHCWATQALAKAGTLAIIGSYPPTDRFFPVGQAMNKNLTVRMGHCPHRRYIPRLLRTVRSNRVDTSFYIDRVEPLALAVEAYRLFDRQETGWLKVALTLEE